MANILVVDDEESIRYTFHDFLACEGYRVETAETCQQALSRIEEQDFDIILADIIIPGGTGIDILEKSRSKNPLCPVIMITGAPDVRTATQSVRLGAFDYLSKPVDQGRLLRVASQALQFKRLQEEKERYRLMLQATFRSIRDAIITFDRKMVITSMNRSAIELCGLKTEHSGKILDLRDTGCRGYCLSLVKQTISEGEPKERYRVECRRDGRKNKIVTISTSPLSGEPGMAGGSVLVIRDETHVAGLERDLREQSKFYNMIGRSSRMQSVYSMIEDLSRVDTTILIYGESGTGKELVADAIHFTGNRSDRPFIRVNCSALPESLLETELFGHVRGAFTGADRDRVGRFESAAGGTIFLDEIGDISPQIQAKLLRVLEYKEIERVGDSRPVRIDVRIITATNKNLRDKVRKGTFREDLFYRLKVVELKLPPLREKREDIPLLVSGFIRKFCGKTNKNIENISADVLDVFMNYAWPGNIRELEHVLEHASILCPGTTITLDDLPPEFIDMAGAHKPVHDEQGSDDQMVTLAALEKAGWNKSRAARLLGINVRTIYRRMEKYGISEPNTGAIPDVQEEKDK